MFFSLSKIFIGNGRSIQFCKDSWVDSRPLADLFPDIYSLPNKDAWSLIVRIRIGRLGNSTLDEVFLTGNSRTGQHPMLNLKVYS